MGLKTYIGVFPHVAVVKDDGDLKRTYEALSWLEDRNYEADVDFKVDMMGGREGKTHFYFKKSKDAVIFKLSFP